MTTMRGSHKVLLGLLALYTVQGAAVPHVTHGPDDVAAANVLLAFPTGILLFSWCKLDARERCIECPAPAACLVGGLALVGVPYYFFKTKRMGAALLGIFAAIAFYLVILAAQWSASYVSAKVVI